MSQSAAASSRPTSTGQGAGAADGDIADIATGLATGIASAAVEQGRNLLDNARGQATGFADDRKNAVAQSIADVASSLRDSGGTFEDRPSIKAFVGGAADGLDQLAGSLRDRTLAELYGDVEAFARARPMTVGIGAVVAGFLLARFIKSTSEDLAESAAASMRHAAPARTQSRRASVARKAANDLADA